MKRKIGLDYFRIFLAIMVILIHMSTKGHGQIVESVSINTPQYLVCWGILSLSYIGVNGFALLSGYLSYDKNHSYKRVIYLYLELLFYSVIISCFFIIYFNEKIDFSLLLNTFFPINSKNWWYINCFIALSFLMPFLDKFINNCTYKEFNSFLKMVFILFCIPCVLFFQNDIFYMENGFSLIWICIMYVIGAGIKKFDLSKKYSSNMYLYTYLIMSLITLLSRVIIDNITIQIIGKTMGSGLLFAYNSPTVFIASITLLMFFINIKNTKKNYLNKYISKLSKGSISSYIIHCHPLFLKYLIDGKFVFLGQQNWIIQLFLTIVIAITIFIICIIIDQLRCETLMFLNKFKQSSNTGKNEI